MYSKIQENWLPVDDFKIFFFLIQFFQAGMYHSDSIEGHLQLILSSRGLSIYLPSLTYLLKIDSPWIEGEIREFMFTLLMHSLCLKHRCGGDFNVINCETMWWLMVPSSPYHSLRKKWRTHYTVEAAGEVRQAEYNYPRWDLTRRNELTPMLLWKLSMIYNDTNWHISLSFIWKTASVVQAAF